MKCTEGKEFCQLHQRDCEIHYYSMPDGKCSCEPCGKKAKKRATIRAKIKQLEEELEKM